MGSGGSSRWYFDVSGEVSYSQVEFSVWGLRLAVFRIGTQGLHG